MFGVAKKTLADVLPETERKVKRFSSFFDGEKGALSCLENLNFYLRASGGLQSGIGCEHGLEDPLGGASVRLFCRYYGRERGRLFVTDDSIVYHSGEEGEEPVFFSDIALSEPCAQSFGLIGGEQFVILSGKEGSYLFNGSTISPVDLGGIRAFCRAQHRVLYLSTQYPTRVYFSARGDGRFWTEEEDGGYVDLDLDDGEIVDMVTADEDKVILFRGHTLTELTLRGMSEDFTLVHHPVSCPTMLQGSAQAVGLNKKVIFACADGLYQTDGKTVQKQPWEIDLSGASDLSFGVFEKYYCLSYTAAGERKTFFFDPSEQAGFLSSLPIALYETNGREGLCRVDGQICRLTERSVKNELPLHKIWESAPTDFELGTGYKFLRGALVKGQGNFTVSVTPVRQDGVNMPQAEQSKTVSVNGAAQIAFNVKGERFRLKIESDDARCHIAELTVTVDQIKTKRGKRI